MDGVSQALTDLLGLDRSSFELEVWQMMVRAAVIYVATVMMVRIGKERFFGRATAFDVVLGIMLGSVVGRAITGNAPIVPALAAAATLVLMHWLFSWIALRWHAFGAFVKGRATVLIEDGEVRWDAVRRAHITKRDLLELLRSEGVESPGQVAEARLERSGKLSVITRSREPRVVDVEVHDGVQTVRIEMS